MIHFRDSILQSQHSDALDQKFTVQDVLIETILKEIELDRNGDIIDRPTVKSCVDMLLAIPEPSGQSAKAELDEQWYTSALQADFDKAARDDQYYTSTLEAGFLRASLIYYQSERNSWLREASVDSYHRMTKARVTEELSLCRSILPESTAVKVAQILEDMSRERSDDVARGNEM